MKLTNQPDDPEKGAGRNQKPLLLVLLVLVAVFAYLYFFTGLITPRQEQQPAPPPVAEVKKPLPPRPEAEGEKPAEPQAKAQASAPPAGTAQKPKAAEPPAAAKPQPAPAVAQAPAAKAPEKPAPAKAVAPAPKEPPKAAPVAKEAAKPAPAASGVAKEKAPAPAAKAENKPAPNGAKAAAKPAAAKAEKPAEPAGKSAPAAAKKGDAVKKADKEPAKKGDAAKATVTLLVGEFVPDRDFRALQERLKKMGLSPLHTSEQKKAKPMNRLYVGEYPNYDTGAAELERVKKLSADAFFIESGGKYRVYAGSYYGSRMAEQVKAGLAAKGVSTTLQKADVPVTVVRLTAGRFADKAAAAKTVKKLKAAGLSPVVVPLAR